MSNKFTRVRTKGRGECFDINQQERAVVKWGENWAAGARIHTVQHDATQAKRKLLEAAVTPDA